MFFRFMARCSAFVRRATLGVCREVHWLVGLIAVVGLEPGSAAPEVARTAAEMAGKTLVVHPTSNEPGCSSQPNSSPSLRWTATR